MKSHTPECAGTLDRIVREDDCIIIVREPHLRDIRCEWFNPAAWGSDATPVEKGGRGSAWFVGRGKEWVLRWYTRGGLVAKLSRCSYFFTGFNRARSIAEFRMLSSLYMQGFPVPEPVGACFRRTGFLTYRAALLIERIPRADSFAGYLGKDEPELWFSVGSIVRRFHDAGVDHADLNCDNILVADDGIFLIDFDRGRIRRGSGGWRDRNLRRLRRSIDKLSPAGCHELNERLWHHLREGYDAPGQA